MVQHSSNCCIGHLQEILSKMCTEVGHVTECTYAFKPAGHRRLQGS